MDLQIPNKIYFKIGEVAQFMGVEPYVLRYWETEFPEIAPVKSKSKQRLYKREDVEKIAQIRDLLHKQGFFVFHITKKPLRGGFFVCLMVPAEGIEPTHCYQYEILSLARLPVPPRRQRGKLINRNAHCH